MSIQTIFFILISIFAFNTTQAQEIQTSAQFLRPVGSIQPQIPKAVSDAVQKISGTTSSSTQLIATVNFLQASIVSQKVNSFTLKFKIGNREQVQPQVIYSVELVKSGDQKTADVVFDQKTYSSDILSLSANDSVEKTITYEAPQFLAGDYTLKLHARNEGGLDLALMTLGNVTLWGSNTYLSIENASCALRIVTKGKNKTPIPLRGVAVSANETLEVICPVSNQSGRSITATPSFQVYKRTISGDLVREVKGEQIFLQKGESKKIIIALPKEETPQVYEIKMVLDDERGTPASNETIIPYAVNGDFATMITTLLDKDVYRTGDAAVVTSRVSASSPEVLKDATLTLSIKDVSGKVCANEDVVKISESGVFVTVHHTLPILLDCKNPILGAVLKDVNGKVLDEKTFSVETKIKAKSEAKGISVEKVLTIFALLIVIAITPTLFRRFKQRRSQVPLVVLFLVGVIGAFFSLGIQPVYADTYAGTFGSTIGDGSGAYGGEKLTYSVTINYSAKTITPGQGVTMDALLSVNINVPSYIYNQADLICALDWGKPTDNGYKAGPYNMYLYAGATYDLLRGGVTNSVGHSFNIIPMTDAQSCGRYYDTYTMKCSVLTRIDNPIENKVRGFGLSTVIGLISAMMPAIMGGITDYAIGQLWSSYNLAAETTARLVILAESLTKGVSTSVEIAAANAAAAAAAQISHAAFSTVMSAINAASLSGITLPVNILSSVQLMGGYYNQAKGTKAIFGTVRLPDYTINMDQSACAPAAPACPAGQIPSGNDGACTTPPVPKVPTNLKGTCSADGAIAEISWAPAIDAVNTEAIDSEAVYSYSSNSGKYWSYYQVRVNDTTKAWSVDKNGKPNQGDISENIMENARVFTTIPGHTYAWWIHACNGGSVCSTIATTVPIVCPIPAKNLSEIPAVPTNLVSSCSATGLNASFSWSPASGANHYKIRIDNKSNGWSGDCNGGENAGDLCKDSLRTSSTLPVTPENSYAWWVHACNNVGCSDAAPASPVVCSLAIPPAPTTLQGVCSADGESITVSGAQVPWATYYKLRIDNINNGWVGDCSKNQNPGDICDDNVSPVESKTFKVTVGQSYVWWVHACNASGCSTATNGSNIVCKSSADTAKAITVAPQSPTNLASSVSSDTDITISWSPVSGATHYQLRVDNNSNGWSGSCNGSQNSGDICENVDGTSKTFSSTAGQSYSWWVHACNASGCSAAASGSNIVYKSSADTAEATCNPPKSGIFKSPYITGDFSLTSGTYLVTVSQSSKENNGEWPVLMGGKYKSKTMGAGTYIGTNGAGCSWNFSVTDPITNQTSVCGTDSGVPANDTVLSPAPYPLIVTLPKGIYWGTNDPGGDWGEEHLFGVISRNLPAGHYTGKSDVGCSWDFTVFGDEKKVQQSDKKTTTGVVGLSGFVPIITEFRATPERVLKDGITTLSWGDVVGDGCSVTKSPSSEGWPKFLDGLTSIADTITTQTSYTLFCSGSKVLNSVLVNVVSDIGAF